jgi:hypothetical protein
LKIEIGTETKTKTIKRHKYNVLETVLREKCGLCDECIQLYMDVDLDAYTSTNTNKDHNEGFSSSLHTTMCPLCLGLLSKGSSNDDTFHHQLMNTAKEKFQPYSNSVLNHEGAMDMNTNMSINSISKESPMIALPQYNLNYSTLYKLYFRTRSDTPTTARIDIWKQ